MCYHTFAAWLVFPYFRRGWVLDWSVLVMCIHYFSYQALSHGRTAVLLSIKGVEHAAESEVKILLYLMMALLSVLWAPVDSRVHAVACIICPTVYVMALVVLGTALNYKLILTRLDTPGSQFCRFCIVNTYPVIE